MPYTAVEIAEYGRKLDRSRSTLFKWISEGCNLRDDKSVREWVTRNTIRETNISKARKRRRDKQSSGSTQTVGQRTPDSSLSAGNGELPEPGRKGAAGALLRLEASEEEAHRRLQAALERGNALEIEAAQSFWLRVAETLRRLDAGLELGRRGLEEQVPKKLACDVAVAISDWLRISFMIFLSSECQVLMGIRNTGEWKNHAVQAFKSILHLTVRNSLKTNSPIPDWAAEKIKESWNVSE
jgi:hypothetical protein